MISRPIRPRCDWSFRWIQIRRYGLAGGGGILGYGFVRKLIQWGEFDLFQQHGPLMALGFMLVVAAMLLLATGLIGELMMRVYFEASNARTYAIRRIVRKDDESETGPKSS